MINFRSLFLLLAVLTVWIPSCAFANKLQCDLRRTHCFESSFDVSDKQDGTNRSLKWTNVYDSYRILKELCHFNNKAFGSMLTVYLADSLVTQAVGLDASLIVPDIFLKIRLLFFIVVSAGTFLLAADVSDKVKSIKLLKYPKF